MPCVTFTYTITLTDSPLEEEVPLDHTGSVDGTSDESAQKNTQVTLFMHGAETAESYEELNATEPTITKARLDREGHKLERELADKAFTASVERDGDPDFCAQVNAACSDPGNCKPCAGLTEEQDNLNI
jgi:hypothetical protein